MIWLKNIRVWTLEIEAIHIAWGVVDTTEDLADYTVSVWRSESMVGPYQQVSGEIPADQSDEFRDTTVNRLSLRREHIYRLRVRKVSDGSTLFFGSRDVKRVLEGEDPLGVALESVPELLASESVRRFELVAREKAGRKALHLRRRTMGQFCPACWESETRRAIRSGCEVCWGTHRAGGYYSPQVFWPVRQPPEDRSVDLTALFEMQRTDEVLRTSCMARLTQRDLIIYPTAERWYVVATRNNHRGGSMTWQFVQVRQLPPTDIEHKLPITWPVDSLTAGPVRTYVHATDIDSYRAAVVEKGLQDEPVGTKDFPTTPLQESG